MKLIIFLTSISCLCSCADYEAMMQHEDRRGKACRASCQEQSLKYDGLRDTGGDTKLFCKCYKYIEIDDVK